MSTRSILTPNKFILLISLLTTLQINSSHAIETSLTNDELPLFGIGIHQEQLNDIYLGALFAPNSVTSSKELLDENIAKNMSLKFISKYSNRKMARFWKQRIAMNNPKTSWQSMTKEIIQFANIFKQAMQPNDEIKISFSPNDGTLVYLNGTLFLTIAKPEFYNLVLNVWIGSIPPTRIFKIGITGQNSSETNNQLINQYSNIQPIRGRFDDDLNKKKPLKIAKIANKRKIRSKTSNKQTKISAVKKRITAKAKPQKKRTKKAKSSPTNSSQSNISNLKADINLNFDNLIDIDSIGISTINNSMEPSSTAQKVANKLPATTVEKKTKTVKSQIASPNLKVASLTKPDNQAELFDADLYSGSYTRDLINSIRKVQWYPHHALISGIEGFTTILIKIDKNGNILTKQITQRSGSRALDKAALKMANKAAPFPQIPDSLNMQEFEFSIPLNFTLQK